MNKTELTKQTIFEIKQAKLNAELAAHENLVKLRKENQAFSEKENMLKQLQIEIAQCTDTEKQKSMRFDAYNLRQQLNAEIEKSGYKLSDIFPQPKCEICKDTGAVAGKTCECVKKIVNKKILSLAGLTDKQYNTFESIDKKVMQENTKLKKIFDYAKAFTEKFPDVKYKNMVFIGQVGVGKSYLLDCIASELINKNHFVVYTTAFNLSNILITALTKKVYEQQDIFSTLIDCEVLIIDDLGSELMQKELSLTNLFNILNERKIKGNSTIISSNLMPEQIDERYGNRISSRIFDKRNSQIFLVEGKDLRING